MSKKTQELFETLIPFLVLGISIALLFGLLIMLSYALVWGFVIGGVLWLVFVVKQFLFSNKPSIKESGRIIEHDDKK